MPMVAIASPAVRRKAVSAVLLDMKLNVNWDREMNSLTKKAPVPCGTRACGQYGLVMLTHEPSGVKMTL